MSNKTGQRVLLLLEALAATLSLQEGALRLTSGEYKVNIPVLKYFFVFTEHVQGFGIVGTVLLIGILAVFFYAQKEQSLQKNRYLSVLAVFLGICTVFGRSYSDLGNWDYVFGSRSQFVVAVISMAGYYFLYKNMIIVCLALAAKWNGKPGKVTDFILKKHPFGVSCAILALLGIPYLIYFFPGPMEWDSFSQYAAYFSMKSGESVAAHYPIINTLLMGKCMDLGRAVFDSDAWGVFFYTGPQYVIQWLIFAYCIYVICQINGIPVFVKQLSLGYLALFPLWQIWGITLCKDVYYYLGMLLWVTAMVHIVIQVTPDSGKRLWGGVNSGCLQGSACL